MKDKRIWIVIICILVIGTGVTHYTKYYVKSQATAMDTATTAGGMPAGAPSTASASEVKEEEQKELLRLANIYMENLRTKLNEL